MAEIKSTAVRGRKQPGHAGKDRAAAQTDGAEAKPARRRVPRRKQVEQHARSYFDALARRDRAAVGEHWSDDGVCDIVPLGILRGRQAIVALFDDLFSAVPDLETTVSRLVAGENEAAVEWRMAGHFTGRPFQGVEPTGRRVDIRGLDLIEIAGGKNTSASAYYDGMSFARQIGLMPAQDSGPERALKSAFNATTKLRRALAARRGAS